MKTWSILPAAQCLFGKTKVTLEEIVKEWGSGVVVVCRKTNGQMHFIYGSGHTSYAKIGTQVKAIHDQTLATIGTGWEVVNEVIFSKDKVKYAVDPVSKINMVDKAALAVFK